MGKRNKNRNAESTTECHISDLDTTQNIEEQSIINDSNKHIKKKNKRKMIQEDRDISIEKQIKIKLNNDEHNDISTNVNINKKRNKQDTEKPKKIKCRDEPEEVYSENVSTNKKLKQKQKNKIKFRTDDEPDEVTLENVPIIKKNKQKHNTETTKKIKFGDDGEPEELNSPENMSANKKVNKDKKSYLNAEEQDVKDEDIDQFCDDIDEEENKQYESWITLLEQKLGNNQGKVEDKNKKKNKK